MTRCTEIQPHLFVRGSKQLHCQVHTYLEVFDVTHLSLVLDTAGSPCYHTAISLKMDDIMVIRDVFRYNPLLQSLGLYLVSSLLRAILCVKHGQSCTVVFECVQSWQYYSLPHPSQ